MTGHDLNLLDSFFLNPSRPPGGGRPRCRHPGAYPPWELVFGSVTGFALDLLVRLDSGCFASPEFSALVFKIWKGRFSYLQNVL